MIKRIPVLVLCSLAAAGPAMAQPKDGRPNEVVSVKRRPPVTDLKVTGFAPPAGPAGTQVTISGEGFTPETRILIGGKAVSVANVTPTSLAFKVPNQAGDGSIILRHPGVARDVPVGVFSLIVDPSLVAFTPNRGAVGTRVELKGSGFRKGDQVIYGAAGTVIGQFEADTTRIVVVIPAGAVTDYFYVQRPGGTKARSSREFTVVSPVPTISGFSPATGRPGTVVRITGANFDPSATVFYAKRPMKINAVSPTTIDAEVPPIAVDDAYITVKSPAGDARSADKFMLARDLTVTRFGPQSGAVDSHVDILGTNFQPGDRVTIGGREMPLVKLRVDKLTVAVPAGARSAPLVVERGPLKVATASSFEVLNIPVVSGFSPVQGRIGARVTITGQNFSSDAKVYYGTKELTVVQRLGETGLVIEIPPSSDNRKLEVRTRAGTAETSAPLQIIREPGVANVGPKAGPVGTRVNLSGIRLDSVSAVFIGGTAAPIIEKSPSKLVIEVPPSATDGPISIEAFGDRTTTRFSFIVVRQAQISSISPDRGAPGSEITINGSNFGPRTTFYFAKLPLRIVRSNLPSQVVVQLPPTARGSSRIAAVTGEGRQFSPADFNVQIGPVIAGFAPRAGKIGSEVTVRGRDFGPDVEVWLAGKKAQIITRQGAGARETLVVRVPDTRDPEAKFRIKNSNGESLSATAFVVLPSAFIGSVDPAKAPRGASIKIEGGGFDSKTRFLFKGMELPAKILGGGKRAVLKLTEALPQTTDYIVVVDGDVQSRSPQTFEVIAPPPPPTGGVIIRDHRKKGN